MNFYLSHLEKQLDSHLPDPAELSNSEKIELIKACALVRQSQALELIANQIKWLGNGNAATEVGAIEGLAMVIAELGDKIINREEKS